MNRDFYIVQRCWHSGHQQQPPLDYLRLFTTQRDAEEAAYHSAHAWSHFGSSGREGSVRTVQLPLHPSDDPERTCYGFTANGTLFWVRGVIARVDDEASQGSAIVTNGVIGWTGDENARRGSEISVGRVRWSMVGPGLVINESRLTPDAKEMGRWLEAMMSPLGVYNYNDCRSQDKEFAKQAHCLDEIKVTKVNNRYTTVPDLIYSII